MYPPKSSRNKQHNLLCLFLWSRFPSFPTGGYCYLTLVFTVLKHFLLHILVDNIRYCFACFKIYINATISLWSFCNLLFPLSTSYLWDLSMLIHVTRFNSWRTISPSSCLWSLLLLGPLMYWLRGVCWNLLFFSSMCLPSLYKGFVTRNVSLLRNL